VLGGVEISLDVNLHYLTWSSPDQNFSQQTSSEFISCRSTTSKSWSEAFWTFGMQHYHSTLDEWRYHLWSCAWANYVCLNNLYDNVNIHLTLPHVMSHFRTILNCIFVIFKQICISDSPRQCSNIPKVCWKISGLHKFCSKFHTLSRSKKYLKSVNIFLRTTSKKKTELDRTQTETKWWQHCQTSATVDATRPQRKNTTEKHLEMRSGEGNVDSGLQVTGGRWRR